MKRNIIATSIALGALALGATAPASADVFGFFDRFSTSTNVIDTIRGNDNRDAKDSTVLRNDVRFDEPMPGASAREPSNPAGQSWAEHKQVENIQRGPDTTTSSDASSAAVATDRAGDPVRSGVPSDSSATVHSSGDASAATDDTLDDTRRNSAQPDAVTPSDGGGEMGVPGPRDSSAETDSFEGARDTAAGVDSTRGAGGGH